MTVYTSPWPEVELPECSVWEKIWSNPQGQEDEATAVLDATTGQTLSRLELRTLAQRLAHGLRDTARLSPGDVVCLFSPNSLDYPTIVLATQCAGLVFSGANSAYTLSELKHQVEESDAKVLLVHPFLLNVALEATSALDWTSDQQQQRIFLAVSQNETALADSRFRTLNSLISGQMLEPHEVNDPKNTVAVLAYSSGTSGKAKCVRMSVYNLTSVLSICEPLKVDTTDVVLAFLPFSHIYGISGVLLRSLHQAVSIVVLPTFSLDGLCSAIQQYRITILPLVPPVALLLARSPHAKKYDLSSLRLVMSAAAPIGAELEEELARALPGCTVLQAFGATETSPVTHIGIDAPRGSVGPLLPSVKARLVDPESGKDVARGESGELWLAGPNVVLGYLNRPKANEETLVQDPKYPGTTWLRTGDIAYVDEKGNFYISDRLKELIKVKGLQLAPAELEGTLLECPCIADCAVIGVWNEDKATEYPRGYVVLSDEGKKQRNPAAAILAWTKGKVAHYKQLKGGIKVVDSIPKSSLGKILRRVLRDEFEQEQKVAKARKEALGGGAKL
ncbi:hypothetical protein JCM6882_003526 [Rhodosporidiobolus microsporus]